MRIAVRRESDRVEDIDECPDLPFVYKRSEACRVNRGCVALVSSSESPQTAPVCSVYDIPTHSVHSRQ